MRIITVFGLLSLVCQSRSESSFHFLNELVMQCKDISSVSPMLNLRRHLFCEYDKTIRPTSSHQVANNVTMKLLPKILEFDEWNSKMTLHSWMTLTWNDAHLTWNPSEFGDIKYIHLKSQDIWVPDLSVYNSGDMTLDQTGIPPTTCLVFSSGSVSCVPSIKHVAKCVTDFSSWPYDVHQCRIKFGSWSHAGEEINIHLNTKGYQMEGYTNNTQWDFKVKNAYKLSKKYECCPNDTYPMIVYEFEITRHHGIMHTTYVIPAIAMMLLTLTVFWLNSRSTERMAVSSVNLICHMLCIFDLHWQLPHNGTRPPNILLYYRDSLALALFALLSTVLLRKLYEMSGDVPYWISTATSFVLNNKAGRFLVLTDNERLSDRILTGENEDNNDLPKSESRSKDSAWIHLAVIIEWLSLFAVILSYIIILATLVLAFNMKIFFFCILYVIFLLTKQGFCMFYACKDILSNAPLQVLKDYLFCTYDPELGPIENQKNATKVHLGLEILQFEVDEYSSTVHFDAWVSMVWKDNHLTWNATKYEISSLHAMSYELWIPDIVLHSESIWEVDTEMPVVPCVLDSDGTIFYVPSVTYTTFCDSDHTWWPYNVMDCYIRLASWSHHINEIDIQAEPYNFDDFRGEPNAEWEPIEMSLNVSVMGSKFDIFEDFTSQLFSYRVLLKRSSTMYSVSYVTMAIVLMTMTVIVLWLEPMTKERMITANFNFVLHLLCILDLHWKIPFNGSETPKLIVFYEKSLILAVFSLILTVVLRYLQELTIDAPKWISSSTITIFKSRVGQVFLVSILDPRVSARIELNADDNTNLVSLEKRESTWQYTSILIGWFAFLIVLFTYVIMLILYLPTSTSGHRFTLKI
ncbi:uncharacterized protein LOC108625585 [Ceratina calcarata]|uniref:Uncharacterized protein LOC108625585 n=1 Tax=Ceratina calcarata TaxID=156304 RepID=A0AAJ7S2T4_9HYME|nr:uncharacterized protein LOC108625585 [Ceratina calcarata]